MPLALNFLLKEHFDSVAFAWRARRVVFNVLACRVVYLLGSTIGVGVQKPS